MKKFFKYSIFYILVVTFVFSVCVHERNSQKVVFADTSSNLPSIQVSGEGIVKVKPDIAYITLGVKTKDQNPQQAQVENTKKMNKVMKILKELGIDEKDIQTSQYSIYPEYRYIEETGERKEDGYIVNHLLRVTVRDIQKLGVVLDKTLIQGVNVSHGIEFGVANEEKYYQEALQEAIENAQGKAQAIGQSLSIKIDKPYTIIERSTGGSSIQYMDRSIKMNAVEESSTSTPIGIGELDIRANVQVMYQY